MAEQQRSGFKGHGNYGQYSDYMTNHKFVANNAKAAARGAGYPNKYYKELLNKQSQNKAKANAEIIETGSGHLTSLVSPKFKDQIDAYVDAQSKKQWELRQEMDRMDPNNPEYLKLKKQREQIVNSYNQGGVLFNQLTQYQQRGIDWTEDYANSNFSVVSDESETSGLAEIFGAQGTAQMSIDDSGNISFGNEDMGYTALNDLPDYQNKAYKSSKTLLSSLTKAYSEGKVLDDNGILLAKSNFTDLMNTEGVDGTMSLAFDNLLDPNNSLLNIDDYENVIAAIKGDDAALALEAEKILTQDLEAAYMDKLKTQHQAGYDDLNKSKNKIKTTLGEDTQKWYDKNLKAAEASGKTFKPTAQQWHARLRNAGYNFYKPEGEGAQTTYMRNGVEFKEDDVAKILEGLPKSVDKTDADAVLKWLEKNHKITRTKTPGTAGGTYIVPRGMSAKWEMEQEKIEIPADYLDNPQGLIDVLKQYTLKD
jgi:hypothetical protein